jgi:hypothetical protein
MAANPDSNTPKPKSQSRRYRYRTLREDYVQFCDGNTVAALILDYFASVDRVHDEARVQGETPSDWRAVSGRFGGLITMLQPPPSRETVRRALDVLAKRGLIEAHPDNGLPTQPNVTPVPNRYRLITHALLRLEREWTATPYAPDAGGATVVADPPAIYVAHESEVIESDHDRVFTPTDQQKAVGILARFYEARSSQLLGAGAQRELNRIAEDYTLAQIEQAVLAVGDKELERPFQYLRRVLSNAAQLALAPQQQQPSPAAGFWGREFTE